MVFPEQVPVFTENDILISSNEYERGDKKTIVGWLKELFLYHYEDKDSFCINSEDRKDFKKVLDIFQTASKMKKAPTIENLHEWEEDKKNTPKKQAAVLNKVRKKLGYIIEEEI